jgi:hypothetical protein
VVVVEWRTDVPQIAGAWETKKEAEAAERLLRRDRAALLRSAVVPLGQLLDALAVLWE